VSIAEILSHPLSLLLIGALVSGLLIPFFTNRWQIHQKGLEIRINLVGRISQTVMRMMTMIESMLVIILKVGEERRKLLNTIREDSVASNKGSDLEKAGAKFFGELNDEYRKFKVDSAVIGTELESYFPTEKIGEEWDKLVREIELFYARTENDFAVARSGGDIGKTDIEIKRKEILHKKHEIIQLVLNTPMARFSLLPAFLRRLFPYDTWMKRFY
jgi:hypothetical protein